MARLVNKQFNSPIGLYSEQNIREVIQRESQILSNGAVGINFNNPNVGKPSNLQNSAVLRMLEEEEQRQRSGQAPSLKRVAWPPPNEGENFGEQAPVQAQVAYQPQGRPIEPPPSTITLRSQAPVSQAPPPVVTSQPATATLKGGKNLRGDMKWPPETVKRQFEEENRQRLELAKGPACRPRLVRKDYGPFFAQHALNASYPGYKAPPGTQFYEQHTAY
jgi:hypothetical protein